MCPVYSSTVYWQQFGKGIVVKTVQVQVRCSLGVNTKKHVGRTVCCGYGTIVLVHVIKCE
jgi:hypothetical protein